MRHEILVLDECRSTNAYLKELINTEKELPKLFTVVAKKQTNGRGQRGNIWISEAEKNLTASILLHPGTIKATEHFYISEVAALAVARSIANYLDDSQKQFLKVKWPNDIYFNNDKIAGILIENNIMNGIVNYSIIGIGLNINQETFPPEANNAISLMNITGKFYEIMSVMKKILSKFEDMYDDIHSAKFNSIHNTYIKRLYKSDGIHNYRDNEGQTFDASFKEILPSGHIVLLLENGEERTFAFKELIYNAD